jgi:hypothetical protein
MLIAAGLIPEVRTDSEYVPSRGMAWIVAVSWSATGPADFVIPACEPLTSFVWNVIVCGAPDWFDTMIVTGPAPTDVGETRTCVRSIAALSMTGSAGFGSLA